MIRIDIPAPKNCEDCPCSYFIQHGEHEGMMLCNVMEIQKTELALCLVDEWAEERPEECPIIEEESNG